MSNVVLTIGGRQFTIACADGEEEHVAGLGAMIDAKVGAMAGQTEVRMLLFAALLLADELHEAKKPPAASADGQPTEPDLAPRLDQLALRLENLAARLED